MRNGITHVGFNAANFGAQGDFAALDRRIASQIEIGCDVCELGATRLDAVAACRLIPHRIADLKAVLSKHAIRYTLHAPIAVNLMDEAHFDLQYRAFEASLELAAECGADVVVFHPGRVHPAVWVDRSRRLLDREAEALTRLGDRANELGDMRIAYENISPNRRIIDGTETSYAVDLIALARQIERINHPRVVACLDVAHAQQGAVLQGFDMIEQSAVLAPFVGHIHFSDATGVPSTIRWDNEGERLYFGIGDMHAPPGFGSIDYVRLSEALAIMEDTAIVIELKANHYGHSQHLALEAARAFGGRVNGSDSDTVELVRRRRK